MKIDVHAHLAGIGTGDSGCWASEKFRRRPTYQLLRLIRRVGRKKSEDTADQDWAAELARLVRESELDHAVALGFDGVYDASGRIDRDASQMVVPVDWVFRVADEHRELLPGPSLNPNRRDADERLDECLDRGAVLIKWLPATHGIDPADPKLVPFYRRLADAGLPLLVHSGGREMTFAEVAPEYGDLRRLELPLQEGVPVICAHSATRVVLSRDEDQTPILHDFLERFPNLWVDNSGVANVSRFPHLPRLARDPLISERTLHGSDYPVPVGAFYYPRALGPRRVWTIQRVKNPVQRSVQLHRAIGFGEEIFTRASRVLRFAARR